MDGINNQNSLFIQWINEFKFVHFSPTIDILKNVWRSSLSSGPNESLDGNFFELVSQILYAKVKFNIE